MPKQICANCHFFCKQYRNDRGAEHTLEVSCEQRERAKQGDLSWQRESESLGCYKGIWDEGHRAAGHTMVDLVSKRVRRGKCYFFEFQPGTFMQAAEKLQQERIANANELKKYRLAIYGLLLAIVGLAAKLISEKF
jgi:hypothetical protein